LQDPQTRARAIDNNQFYGFYSLVFEEKSTANKMAEVRKRDVGPAKSNTFVDAVTSDDPGDKDSNPDIIDRITGKIRRRQDAPEPTATTSGGKGKPTVSASAPPPAPAATVSDDDDPLKGLL
jgi:hypothetical protein